MLLTYKMYLNVFASTNTLTYFGFFTDTTEGCMGEQAIYFMYNVKYIFYMYLHVFYVFIKYGKYVFIKYSISTNTYL